jgi:peptidoglycan hydrolase-like protein with peptidoglycan-binding domain
MSTKITVNPALPRALAGTLQSAPPLSRGTSGDEVRALQSQMVKLGFLPQGAADGAFGDQTVAALKAFQASAGLAADGVAGRTTLSALARRSTGDSLLPAAPASPPRPSLTVPLNGPQAAADPSLGAVAAAAQAALRHAAVRGPAASVAPAASRLSAAPLFTNASPADQRLLTDLVRAGQADALLKLGDTLFSKDAQGTRLIDSAHRLAIGPMKAELEPERAAVLANVLAEVADPSLINQRRRGSCTVTSAELALAKRNPAEVVRLVAGLSSPEGKVAMASGDVLERVAGTERPDDSGRTPSQRLLQAALMDFGNGLARYDNQRDANTQLGLTTSRGLSGSEIARVVSALSGKPAQSHGREATGLLHKLGSLGDGLAALSDAATLHKFHFTKSGDDLFSGLQKAGPGAVAELKWRTGGHAVVFDHVAEGRVYFANPQGNQKAQGQSYTEGTSPLRRAEGKNLQSMSVEDFRARLLDYVE